MWLAAVGSELGLDSSLLGRLKHRNCKLAPTCRKRQLNQLNVVVGAMIIGSPPLSLSDAGGLEPLKVGVEPVIDGLPIARRE